MPARQRGPVGHCLHSNHRPRLQVLEPYQLPPEARQEAEGTTSLERAARQVARERAALSALPEAAQGHALQVRTAQAAATRWLAWQCRSRWAQAWLDVLSERPVRVPPLLQLLRMHLLENVRVRVEAGHIDYVNELR